MKFTHDQAFFNDDVSETAVSGVQRICCDCGDAYFLSRAELGWYREQGQEKPRRCLACRRTRREKSMEDQDITCRDCSLVFVWTIAEQDWFAQRNLAAPKRCKACRQARRVEGRPHG